MLTFRWLAISAGVAVLCCAALYSACEFIEPIEVADKDFTGKFWSEPGGGDFEKLNKKSNAAETTE